MKKEHDYILFESTIILELTICLFLNRSLRSTCLRAGPLSIPRTRVAKFSEHNVSPKSAELGLTWTNIKVLQSPPAFQSRSNLINYVKQKLQHCISNHKRKGHLKRIINFILLK